MCKECGCGRYTEQHGMTGATGAQGSIPKRKPKSKPKRKP